MNRHFFLLLSLSILSISTSSNVLVFQYIPLPNHVKEAPLTSSLIIQKSAYQSVFSLGDTFNQDGLVVEYDDGESVNSIDDYLISGYNPFNLGEQLITIAHEGLQTNYTIKVTNEDAIFFPLVGEDLFISEYVRLDDTDFAIELFNGTNNAIDIETYSISINENKTIELEDVSLSINETYVIASDSSSQEILDKADQVVENLYWSLGDTMKLYHDETFVDVISVNDDSTSTCINGACSLNDVVLTRKNKHVQVTSVFDKNEWYAYGNDLSHLGQYQFATANLTYEQQAKAFGEYVMYGAGMFAAGRVEEAYQQLKEEYGFMDINAKAFFIQSPNYEIEGNNEEGKFDKSTFKEAFGRIGVLASRNGEQSLLPHSSSFSSNNNTIKNAILIALIAMAFIGIYLFLKLKKIIH